MHDSVSLHFWCSTIVHMVHVPYMYMFCGVQYDINFRYVSSLIVARLLCRTHLVCSIAAHAQLCEFTRGVVKHLAADCDALVTRQQLLSRALSCTLIFILSQRHSLAVVALITWLCASINYLNNILFEDCDIICKDGGSDWYVNAEHGCSHACHWAGNLEGRTKNRVLGWGLHLQSVCSLMSGWHSVNIMQLLS